MLQSHNVTGTHALAASDADPAAEPTDLAPAIDAYVAATYRHYERAMTTLIPAFSEPRFAIGHRDDRALKRLRFLIETLTGIAIGTAVGHVATAMRRRLGDPLRDAVTVPLTQLARIAAPSAEGGIHPILPRARFLDDAARPLLNEFGARLHLRLCQSMPACRSHLAAIGDAVDRVAPNQLDSLASVLLASDDAAALAFGDHLALGWQHYNASIAGSPVEIPEVIRPRIRDTWRAWTRRLSGPAPKRERAQEELRADGYMVRIE